MAARWRQRHGNGGGRVEPKTLTSPCSEPRAREDRDDDGGGWVSPVAQLDRASSSNGEAATVKQQQQQPGTNHARPETLALTRPSEPI